MASASTRLTGAELLERVRGKSPSNELAIACGYSKTVKGKDGTIKTAVQRTAFLTAITVASGATEAPERKRTAPPQRVRSYVAKSSGSNGSVVVSVGYLQEIGCERESFFKIIPLPATPGQAPGLTLQVITAEEAEALRAAVAAEEGEEGEDDDAPDEADDTSSLLAAAVAERSAALPVAV